MSRKQHPQSRGMKKRAANKVRVKLPRAKNNTSENTSPPNYEPLAWSHKSGSRGVFNALYEEMMNDVPPELRAPPAERIAMYHRVRAALAQVTANGNTIGSDAFDIPWTMLDFPEGGVGREKRVKRGHVGNIVQNFRPASWALPVVVMRPVYGPNGQLQTVLFEVTDGMHRTRVALELAYATRPHDLRTGKDPAAIKVSVSEGESLQDSAHSFADNNGRGKEVMAKSDDWRNMYIAGEPTVVRTIELAADYGLDASAPVDKRGWPRCHGKIIMHMCNIDFGGVPYHFPWMKEEDVRAALRFITDEECTGVYGVTHAVNKQNFFGGLCHFIAYYYRPGYIHDIGIKRLLARPGIVETAIGIGGQYNSGLIRVEMPHVTDAMLSRNESLRYHQVAAALRRLYVAQVPPPKARSAADGWPDCPADLRRLFHTAPTIVDAVERRRFIDSTHKKLNALTKKSRGSKNSSIVR